MQNVGVDRLTRTDGLARFWAALRRSLNQAEIATLVTVVQYGLGVVALAAWISQAHLLAAIAGLLLVLLAGGEFLRKAVKHFLGLP